jgi:DNA-binding transcriptional MocR family regulator
MSHPQTSKQLGLCLYEQVAEELIGDISNGLYQAGQKLPSVRKHSQRRRVSISTVMQAYSVLEDRGLIRAKPQSGYYVKDTANSLQASPKATSPVLSSAPATLNKGDLIQGLLQQSQQAACTNFGAAIADSSLLPHRALQPHMQKAIRFQSEAVFSYQFCPGYEPLRKQIALRMRNSGVHCHHDEIIITQGCTEALSICLRSQTTKGDTIAIESPCYYGFLQCAEVLGLKVIEIPADPVNGISVEALSLALEQWPIKAVLMSSRYSNPSGASVPESRKIELVRLANRHNTILIEDDTYGEIGHQFQQQKVLKSYDSENRVMYCSSFSKTIAPGLRLGWCIPGKDFEQVKKLQMFNTFAASSLSQCAVASFLEKGHFDKHLRKLQRTARENTRHFINVIQTCFPKGSQVIQPQGGFVLWLALPETVNAIELQTLALKHDIAIVPGDIFSANTHYQHHIRLNCALPLNRITSAAMETLGQLAHQLDQRR